MSAIPNVTGFDAGMPANIDAEKVILGAILLDNAAHSEASEKIADGDFWLDSHRRIFRRMSSLMDLQRAVDIVTLSEELLRNKELETVGGVAYLASLTEGLPRRPVIDEYIRIVKDKSLARRLMFIASAAIARAADGTETALETIDAAVEQLQESAARCVEGGQQVCDFIADAAARFEAEADAEPSGLLGASLLTGEVDRITCGVMSAELALMAARPGQGKTQGAIQCTLANARRGLRVHIQSLEMKREQLLRRLWGLIARVPVRDMRDPRCLRPEQRQAIRRAQEELADLPIFIDDKHELTVNEFRSRAILAAKRWKADLIIVDYAQLLIVPRAKSIIEAAPKQAETLRHIARDYCRTLALAQLRRAPPNDLNRYPDIEDILGSSAFEQAAQIILLLHRTREKKRYTGEDFCFIGKMRELQTIEPLGIEAEKWGEFRDRYEPPEGVN
jgi:replicative DNA helicase